MAKRMDLEIDGTCFTRDGRAVTLMALLPMEAQATNDAHIAYKDSPVAEWYPSASLRLEKPETPTERWQRQSEEARQSVVKDMEHADGTYWMSSGGKSILTVHGPIRGRNAEFGAVQIYEWGSYEASVDLTWDDVRDLRDWLNANVT